MVLCRYSKWIGVDCHRLGASRGEGVTARSGLKTRHKKLWRLAQVLYQENGGWRENRGEAKVKVKVELRMDGG